MTDENPTGIGFGLCHECKTKNCDYCIGLPCECSCPVPSYFLYTTDERGWGDTVLWWKKDGAGYTRFIEEAGGYLLAEAEKIVRGGHSVAMVKAPEAYASAKRVVRIEDLEGTEENYQKARSR